MQCPRCQHENRPGAKFCEECAAPAARACENCGAQLSPTAEFCSECAHPAGSTAPPAPRFGAPETYTPKHLAERIINSKATLEVKRKQVTVLFADLKGSMELLADRDPEEARKLLDPVLERMMESVHRYEGTVNQVMGETIMALVGARADGRPWCGQVLFACDRWVGRAVLRPANDESAGKHRRHVTDADHRAWSTKGRL
jgi:double zinc ribbon protein